MSDLNDDILNDELGDADVSLDVLNEDDLLLSDEETGPVPDIALNSDELLYDSEEWIKANLMPSCYVANGGEKVEKNAVLVAPEAQMSVVDNKDSGAPAPSVQDSEASKNNISKPEKEVAVSSGTITARPQVKRANSKKSVSRNNSINSNKKLNTQSKNIKKVKTDKSAPAAVKKVPQSIQSNISSSESNILDDILELDLVQTEKDESTDTDKNQPPPAPFDKVNHNPNFGKKQDNKEGYPYGGHPYSLNRSQNHKVNYRYRNPGPAQLSAHENEGYSDKQVQYPRYPQPMFQKDMAHSMSMLVNQNRHPQFQNRLSYPMANNEFRPKAIRPSTSNFGPNNNPFYNANNRELVQNAIPFSMRALNGSPVHRMPSLISPHHPSSPSAQAPLHLQQSSISPMQQVRPQAPHKSAAGPTNMAVPPTLMLPRKVLINPNFKGGVEAATNQLLREQMSLSNQISDYELLRRQEEFITKNLMHVEKRRFERSPSWDKDRDRNYSPPRRPRHFSRGKDVHRSPVNKQVRRNSRDNYDEYDLKKTKSSEKNLENQAEEDEETKAYRLQIETQKEKREKMIKEKERRRKLAAVEKLKEEKKVSENETSKICKPVAITNKIISLKKTISNPAGAGEATATATAERKTKSESSKIPSNKTQTTGTKSKSPIIVKKDNKDASVKNVISNKSSSRRIVIKPCNDDYLSTLILNKTVNKSAEDKKPAVRGIFDRLEKKVGVSEADKRKIQRLVHNNSTNY